jgi:hypothetical protein
MTKSGKKWKSSAYIKTKKKSNGKSDRNVTEKGRNNIGSAWERHNKKILRRHLVRQRPAEDKWRTSEANTLT